MSFINVTGVSGGSAREARTAGTMNIYEGPVYNIIIVQRQDENSDELIARLKGLVSKLPGDTRLLSLQQETTVMLIGRAGIGKSSLGNTILGRRVFKSLYSPETVTTKFQAASDGLLSVIDTPGRRHIQTPNSEAIQEIQREMVKSVVHVVIFVACVTTRYTKEEELIVEMYKQLFVDCTRHMMVVFTHKDQLDYSEESMDDCVRYQTQHFRQLLKDCGDRYMTVSNKAGSEEKEQFRLSLMDHINQVKRLTGGSGIRINQPELDNTKNDVCNIM